MIGKDRCPGAVVATDPADPLIPGLKNLPITHLAILNFKRNSAREPHRIYRRTWLRNLFFLRDGNGCLAKIAGKSESQTRGPRRAGYVAPRGRVQFVRT